MLSLQVLDIVLASILGLLLVVITSFSFYAVAWLPRRITGAAVALVDKHESQGSVVLTILWHIGATALMVAMGFDLISYVIQAHCVIFFVERVIVFSNYLGIRTRAHKSITVYKKEVLQSVPSA